MGELPSALGVGCPPVPCPAVPAGKAEPVWGVQCGGDGDAQGALAGVAVPPQSRGLLSLGSPEHRRGVLRCCVVAPFQGGLILRGPGSSVGVSHAELLGALGLCSLGAHRGHWGMSPHPGMPFAAGQCRGALRTGHLCGNGPDLPGRNCLKYGATFTSVTQRKLSSSFCWRCSLR